MAPMDVTDYVAAIEAAALRIGSVLEDVDLDASVPSCPDWSARDLVRHLGGVHSWARTIVEHRLPSPPREELEALVGGWPSDGDLLAWFQTGSKRLADVLRSAPETLTCWTFLEGDTPLVHWARRQAHETAIHRVDAELAAGVEPESFDQAFAADGIDELLTGFITRDGRGPRSATPETFRLRSTDSGEAWTVYYDAHKAVTQRCGDPDADAFVRGSASDLYRWVWHRLHRDSVEVVGDDSVIDDWNTVRVEW